MAVSRKNKVIIGLVLAILFGLFYIHTSVYPFSSVKPNFADVERVFNRMQFPAEWEEIRSSENRGIAGRQCPIEPESYCFHIGREFSVPETLSNDTVEGVLKEAGCEAVAFDESSPIGGNPYTNFVCATENIDIRGTLSKTPENWEISITAYS